MSGCELTEITKSFGPIENRYSIRLSELFNSRGPFVLLKDMLVLNAKERRDTDIGN